MSIKSDKWIRRMALDHGMIESSLVCEAGGQKIVSFGTSSYGYGYGYDIHRAPEFKIFTNINSTVVAPKFDPKSFIGIDADVCIILPNFLALAHPVEYFRIPRNVLPVCLGKSTYVRCGTIINVISFALEWERVVTLEFSNIAPLPAKRYAGKGYAQELLSESNEVCEISYKDCGGKYQGQEGGI
jgi:dCTP deaminase